jgi:RimJ/RimL family protein N-acetyltransferase
VLGGGCSVVGLDPHPAHGVGNHRHSILLQLLCDATRVDERSNVELRDVVESDLPVFFEHQREPEANEMAAFPPRERDAFMAHWKNILLQDERQAIRKTVVVDGRVAGNVVSWEQDGRREIGYWIGKEFWGRGIATKAARQFVEHVTLRPLYAEVARHNAASIRVLEKCGFTVDPEPPEDADDDVIWLKLAT